MDIIRLLFAKKPDQLYITLSRSLIGSLRDHVYIRLLRPKKIIAHLHGKGYLLSNRFFKANITFADVVIVLTELSRNELSGLYGVEPKRIVVIGNPVFEEDLLSDEVPHINGKLSLYYFSNLMIEKGFQSFLTISDRFREKYVFRAAGKDFIGMRNYPDYLEYVGGVYGEEKQLFLKKGNIHLFLSKYKEEFYPLSMIESLVSGNMCIALRHNGLEKVFKDCGVLWLDNIDELVRLLDDEKLLLRLYNRHIIDYKRLMYIIRRKFSLEKFESNIKIVFAA